MFDYREENAVLRELLVQVTKERDDLKAALGRIRHCKDCKHYYCGYCAREMEFFFNTRPDGFCHCAKPKEEKQ